MGPEGWDVAMKCMVAVLAFSLVLAIGARATPDESAVWSVAGKEVLRLHATVGAMTPLLRVEEVDHRLNEILSKADAPITSADILAHNDKGTVYISINGDLLVTVDGNDAAPNHMTPDKLVQVWLSNIRKTVPQLSPRVNRGGA